MASSDGFSDVWGDLGEICPDPPDKRPECDKCKRPTTVCWCPYVPREPIDVKTTVYILQHPFEETRTLQTARMLLHGIRPGKCCIFQGKRFSFKRYPALEAVIKDPRTILMFPGPNAVNLTDYLKHNQCSDKTEMRVADTPHNLVLLDGTWPQAKGIYCQNTFLHSLKQVQLKDTGLSEYVIRTQPNDSSLSTLETASIALSLLENRPEIKEMLIQPLRALCDFQIQHGAVKHQSRQYLIDNGLYVSKQAADAAKKKQSQIKPDNDKIS